MSKNLREGVRKEIIIAIADYYYKVYRDYKEARDAVKVIDIRDITLLSDADIVNFYDIEITTGRPGMLIGKGGSNIETLESFLKERGLLNEACNIVLKDADYSPTDIMVNYLGSRELSSMYGD